MKVSTIRIILAVMSVFPALVLCGMWGLMTISALFTKGDLSAIPFGFPFIACLIIFGFFVSDTIKLIKEGK